jgi:Cytochrome c
MMKIGLLALAVTALGADPVSPTFYKDVLPILQKNCQACHRPGEAGPMPLLTFEQVRPWAKSIKAAVAARKMPPWFADPAYGHFSNDRRLSEAEIAKIAAWVDAGAVEGNPKDAPAPAKFADGWNIAPDLILQMPDALPVPASGTLEYTYVVIPTGFTRDTWISAAEVRPSNRAVVHHITAVIRPRGSPWMKDAKPFVPYVPPKSARDGQPDADDPQASSFNVEFLAGYSPGIQAQRFDVEGAAKLVPAGADIVLQLHYQPNGKPASDQTRVGLAIAKEAPRRRLMSATASGWQWTIAPGDANAEGHARLTFGEPVTLVSLQPHMHLRGKNMTVRLTYPDGRDETILAVPRYDFNWQIVYELAAPLKLPMGTRVEVTAHWDNSANNPRNPDPSKTVRWGNQSTDEMLSLPMSVLIDRY